MPAHANNLYDLLTKNDESDSEEMDKLLEFLDAGK